MYRLARVGVDGIHWNLKRNCSGTPKQMAVMYLVLFGLSVAVAAFFWSRGAWMVPLFSGVELLAVTLAFVLYARHAVDAERISLCEGRLVVEREEAGERARVEFVREAVRVESPSKDQPLVILRCGAGVAEVGRHVRPALRPVLAQELKRALREQEYGSDVGIP